MAEGGRRERKVVTVVFADLVGFTSRAESLDPEDVEAILGPYHERLRGELERFGGTVEKFIGDAVMALFGAPVAHEDDPERAVRAALAIRDRLAEEGRLEARIAVNTGVALVRLGARPAEGEGMAAGDVVNTAARLQSAAPVNGVLVGEATYRATRHAIDYREAEPVAAKGKTEPVRVWEAVEVRARLGVDVRQHGLAPLVGRARELETLVSAFERARQEPSPQLVTLVGAPGIGKSRLVFELFGRVEEDTDLIFWRQGRSLPYGESMSFWALAEIVKAHCGILEGDAPEVGAAKLREAVELVVDSGEAAWVEGHLRALVGAAAEVEAGGDRSEAFTAWRRFLEGLAERGPLVLVFEDLHWADEGLLDFVDHLVDWAQAVAILVIVTARPELLERRPAWGGGKLNASTLLLSPLGDEDAARLVASLLEQSVLPADTQQALLERAGGNPLYAEQYVRLFLERGSAADLPPPETVHGIVAARLDGLPADEKRLLQDAAVMGKVFWVGVVVALTGREREALVQPLHALVRKEFLRRERRASVSGEEELSFRHVLVRDIAYGVIPRAERAEKHLAAARWIESLGRDEDHAELLAHHYGAALELALASGRDELAREAAEPARRALRRAGDRALALNAYTVAVGLYRSALQLWPEGDPDRAHVLFGYGRALFGSEETGFEALGEAVGALVALGDLESAAEAEVLLAELGWKASSREQMQHHLDRAVELVAELPPCRAKAHVLSSVSRYAMLASENERAIRFGREAERMADRLGLTEIRAHALNNIGPARIFSGEDGFSDLEEAIKIAAAINSPECVRGYINLAATTGRSGDLRRSHELETEGLRIARRFGHVPNIRFLEAELANSSYFLGDWEAALAAGEAFISAGEQGRHHYQESNMRALRALIRLAREDAAGALVDIEVGLELARAAGDPQALGPALSAAWYAQWTAGRTGLAHELISEAAGDPIVLSFSAGVESSWAILELGRSDVFEIGAGAGMPGSRWQKANRELLDGDLAAAADVYHEIGSLTDEAFCRLRAAERLVGEGRRAEADAQLGRALAFYRSLGATRYVREGEALLAATG